MSYFDAYTWKGICEIAAAIISTEVNHAIHQATFKSCMCSTVNITADYNTSIKPFINLTHVNNRALLELRIVAEMLELSYYYFMKI